MASIVLQNIPILTRITPKLIRVLGCNPGKMTLQGTNTYLLGDGKKRLLFDTGEPDHLEYIENLCKVLIQENATIDNIVLSHWHNDHIGGVKNVLACLNENGKNCNVWKFPRSDSVDEYEAFNDVTIKSLTDGQELDACGLKIRVIHTPGHTTDHCILLVEEMNAIFSGDCILGEGTAVFEDLYDYMNSLRRILDEKPAVIYPGHGNIINDPEERIRYYINHRNEREEQILTELSTQSTLWLTTMDLVEKLYVETPKKLWPAAARNVSHHLEKLLKEKKVVNEKRKTDNEEPIDIWKYRQ